MAEHRRGVLRGMAVLVSGTALGAGVGSATETDPLPTRDRPRSVKRDAGTAIGEHWAMAGGNGGGNRRYGGEPMLDSASLDTAWRYRPDDAPLRYRHAAVADGCVFLNAGGNVHALEAESGDLVWKTDDLGYEDRMSIRTGENRGPVVASGTVYVGGDHLTALDATDGSVRWQIERETEVVVVENGLVYALHESDGHTRPVHVYDTDGAEQWTALPEDAPADDDLETYATAEEITVSGGALYVVVRSAVPGNLYRRGLLAFDARTGEVRWDDPKAGDGTSPELLSSDEIVVFATIADGAAGDVYHWTAFDGETGERLAEHVGTDDVMSVPQAIDGRDVYTHLTGPPFDATTADQEIALRAVDVETDETVWESGDGRWNRGPIVTDETVYLTSWERGLVALSKDGSTERWTFADEDDSISDGGSLVAIDDEAAYLVSPIVTTGDDRELIALRSTGTDESDDSDGDDENNDQSEDDTVEDESEDGDDDSEDGDGDDGADSEGEPDDTEPDHEDDADENEFGSEDGADDIENGSDGTDTDGEDDTEADGEDGSGSTDSTETDGENASANTESESDDGVPGFGIGAGVAGVVGGAVVGKRRLRTRDDE